MRLNLEQVLDIEGERLEISGRLDLPRIARRGERLFPQPVSVEGEAVNRAGVATLRYTLSGLLCFACDRCAAPTERRLCETFSHTVVRALAGEEQPDEFLVAGDGAVPLDEVAADDLWLLLPQALFCREDCRGLCAVCGADLNRTSCGCRPDDADPRLASFRSLL